MGKYLILIAFLFGNSNAYAQKVELSDDAESTSWKARAKKLKSGRKAASKFMNRKVANYNAGAHYLAVNVGSFISSEAYRWGEEDSWDNKADMNLGVTYRVGEWTNSMDLFFRADFLAYKFDSKRPYKLSLMPVIAFPDSKSKFPLYFGIGAGPGIFFKQVSGESSLSLDYNLLMGIRFFNLLENMGFIFETGLKGHVHLLSDGQFNGTYVTLGCVFDF